MRTVQYTKHLMSPKGQFPSHGHTFLPFNCVRWHVVGCSYLWIGIGIPGGLRSTYLSHISTYLLQVIVSGYPNLHDITHTLTVYLSNTWHEFMRRTGGAPSVREQLQAALPMPVHMADNLPSWWNNLHASVSMNLNVIVLNPLLKLQISIRRSSGQTSTLPKFIDLGRPSHWHALDIRGEIQVFSAYSMYLPVYTR